MAHLTAKDLQNERPLPDHVDTLIVGAGMSGLYNAWRILDKKPKTDVIIVERSGRTGGRLDSDLVHFTDGATVKEEEGGMRFTFDLMDNLMALFMMLGLDKEIVPFPMSTGGNNRLYYRGHSFNNAISAEDNYAIWSELYNLKADEQGANPTSFIDTVFNRILAANPQFTERPAERTPEFWQKFRLDCQWNGVPLKDWTLWNLFTDMGFSQECIRMVYGLAGFNGTFLSQMNAGEAYQLLEDFPANPDFKTLQNGFSTLPNALVEKIGKKRIFLNTQVESIDGRTAKGYQISYTCSNEEGVITTYTMTADKVLLCMPRLALEKLFIKSNALNTLDKEFAEKFWDRLQSTTEQPLVKINLYYNYAWWGTNLTGRPPVGYGPNFADLPTGSVYPFYAIDEETFAALEYEKWLQVHGKPVPPDLREKLDTIANKKYNLPAALTIYCDYQNVNFWKALQNNGPMFDSPMQRQYSGKVPQTVFPASRAVVDTATGFFRQIFNTNYVPEPVMTSARIWEGSSLFKVPPSEQFDYGVHQWGLHADDREVISFLTEPMENIYICGEAYSDYQGWVEGALRSANLVLKKAFGLEPISVVYTEKYGKTPSEAVSEAYAAHSAKLIRKYITKDFDKENVQELADAQDDDSLRTYGIKLSYFDVPE